MARASLLSFLLACGMVLPHLRWVFPQLNSGVSPSVLEAEAGGSLVQGQPGLQSSSRPVRVVVVMTPQ